jgi:hypothetical protein
VPDAISKVPPEVKRPLLIRLDVSIKLPEPTVTVESAELVKTVSPVILKAPSMDNVRLFVKSYPLLSISPVAVVLSLFITSSVKSISGPPLHEPESKAQVVAEKEFEGSKNSKIALENSAVKDKPLNFIGILL